MVGKAGLKAGLIGTAIMLIWTVIGRFVPMTGALVWVSLGINVLIYTGVGVMAGLFLTPPRTPGKGAGAGAIAGLIGGVVSGLVGVIIMTIQISSGGDVPGLDPQ
jgi:membrane associated rhomboid family serine protease